MMKVHSREQLLTSTQPIISKKQTLTLKKLSMVSQNLTLGQKLIMIQAIIFVISFISRVPFHCKMTEQTPCSFTYIFFGNVKKIPDNWNWFHFEKETVFQFVLRYAGLYHPRLCYVDQNRWNLSKGENVDPLVGSRKIETKINKEKFPGGGNGTGEESKTKGKLTVKFGSLQLAKPQGEGSVTCYVSLEPETEQDQNQVERTGNFQNLDFSGENVTMTVVTGEEKFGVALSMTGMMGIVCGFKKDVSVLMNEGTIDVEFELVDESEKWGVLSMEVTYERSWC
jgi:hypothetical protein